MTPDQAMQIIVQVTEQFRGTKQEHVTIQQAVQVLSGLLPKSDQASTTPQAD